jgi:hypothetical protein
VLDLACLEGLYAIEFALHGATAVGIEGRETNLAKARFAKEVLALDTLEFALDDVRNLSRERYGPFDVVLCIGIFYHLDTPDLFRFVEQIAEVCGRVAIFDTHVSPGGPEWREYNGERYYGERFHEHPVEATPEEHAAGLWASLDNPEAFWFTAPSLYNLLARSGFTSVYECFIPHEVDKPAGRVTLVAIKGEQQQLRTAPATNDFTIPPWRETASQPDHKEERDRLWDGLLAERRERGRAEGAFRQLEAHALEQQRYIQRLEQAMQEQPTASSFLSRLRQRGRRRYALNPPTAPIRRLDDPPTRNSIY